MSQGFWVDPKTQQKRSIEELADVYRQTITTSALLLGDATVQKSYSDKFSNPVSPTAKRPHSIRNRGLSRVCMQLSVPLSLAWSTFATRWIAILPLSGNEQISAMANEGSVTHRVRMRYTDGLKPKMRIQADGRQFEIMSVMERGRREEHELMVSEVID